MARFVIKSRIHGVQLFTMPKADGGYIWRNGKQICVGGRSTGSTIRATPESFERVCRKWWAAFLRNTR